jgi:hypothetical protein
VPIQRHEIILDQPLPAVPETQNLNAISGSAPHDGAYGCIETWTITASS